MALNKFRVASLLSFVNEKVFANIYTYKERGKLKDNVIKKTIWVKKKNTCVC